MFFSKTLSYDTASSKDITAVTDARLPALAHASNVLLSILSVQVIVSLLLVSLGPPYMTILLHLLLPARYLSTNAPKLLVAWIWYIPVLAFNGVLEAFMASVSTSVDLSRQSWCVRTVPCSHLASHCGTYSQPVHIHCAIINADTRVGGWHYSLRFSSPRPPYSMPLGIRTRHWYMGTS